MLKIPQPQDFMELGASAKIQWAIIIIGLFYSLMFITTAGVVYTAQLFGLPIVYTLQEVALMALGVFLFNIWSKYREFKKELQENQHLQESLTAVRDTLQKAKNKMESSNNIDQAFEEQEGVTREAVIEYLGETSVIKVSFIPREGTPTEEQLKEIIQSSFDGLEIKAIPKSGQENE